MRVPAQPQQASLTRRTLTCAALALAVVAAPACGLRQWIVEHRSPPEVLAFVGRKIALDKMNHPPSEKGSDGSVVIYLDSVFEARYEVLQVVHGDYRHKQISFQAFDHYGVPAFSKYDVVLLYVVRVPGEGWTHVKYQFSPLFEAPPYGWTGCGGELEDAVERLAARGVSTVRGLRAVPVDFQPEAVIDLPQMDRRWFKIAPPHFEARGDKVVCKDGARLQDLFAVAREGVLMEVGLFNDPAAQGIGPRCDRDDECTPGLACIRPPGWTRTGAHATCQRTCRDFKDCPRGWDCGNVQKQGGFCSRRNYGW